MKQLESEVNPSNTPAIPTSTAAIPAKKRNRRRKLTAW